MRVPEQFVSEAPYPTVSASAAAIVTDRYLGSVQGRISRAEPALCVTLETVVPVVRGSW
jgi:hypothetical protein